MESIDKLAYKAIKSDLKEIRKDIEKGTKLAMSHAVKRGVPRSSIFIEMILEVYKDGIYALRDSIKSNHSWAIENCTAFTTPLKKSLLTQAENLFAGLRKDLDKELEKHWSQTGLSFQRDQFFKRLYTTLEDAHYAAVIGVEKAEAVKERGLLKSFLGLFFKRFSG